MRRSVRCGTVAFVLSVVSASSPTPGLAQWRVDAQAGRLEYAPDAASTSLGVGIGHAGLHSDFGISAGLPLSSQEPVWGALYGSRRLIAGDRFRFGIDLAGNGFAYRVASRDTTIPPLLSDHASVSGWGVAFEAFPFAAWSAGPIAIEARAGGVHFTTDSDGSKGFDRNAFVADATLGATLIPALTLRLEGSLVQASDSTFPYAGVGATWSRGITLWGSVGKWFNDTITTTAWTGGASLPLGERVAIVATGRQDAYDPIYAAPARTTWGAGLVLWLGDPRTAVPEPVPASYSNGIATIAIEADDIHGVPSIAGDFNDWTPAPMNRSGDGWVHRFPVAPGVYSYAFVDEAGTWFVPEDTPGRRDDGMGGHVAVLVVDE